MRFIVITGMSGAGKSLVIKRLEDLGFYCVDNMPPALMYKFFELVLKGESKIDKVALVVDIRGGELFNELLPAINFIKETGYLVEILFLEASDETLIKRFKESRRSHPLARSATIKKGILLERKILEEVKDRASYVIDTTEMSSTKLKEKIDSIFSEREDDTSLLITIVSFGFKYGIPADCDLVLDVRFIQNPFYIEEMKKLSGKDKIVNDFVMSHEETKTFITKTVDLLDFLMPYYQREGKSQLLIGLGCTGGHHRSVSISENIFDLLKQKNYTVNIEHRDILKDNRGVGK